MFFYKVHFTDTDCQKMKRRARFCWCTLYIETMMTAAGKWMTQQPWRETYTLLPQTLKCCW